MPVASNVAAVASLRISRRICAPAWCPPMSSTCRRASPSIMSLPPPPVIWSLPAPPSRILPPEKATGPAAGSKYASMPRMRLVFVSSLNVSTLLSFVPRMKSSNLLPLAPSVAMKKSRTASPAGAAGLGINSRRFMSTSTPWALFSQDAQSKPNRPSNLSKPPCPSMMSSPEKPCMRSPPAPPSRTSLP